MLIRSASQTQFAGWGQTVETVYPPQTQFRKKGGRAGGWIDKLTNNVETLYPPQTQFEVRGVGFWGVGEMYSETYCIKGHASQYILYYYKLVEK